MLASLNGPELLQALLWLTIFKVMIASGLGLVLIGSLYKFKKVIMTVFGLLLISNLLILYMIMLVLTK